MREPDLLEEPNLGAAPTPDGGGRPLADAVDGQDGGLLEGRAEEGAGRVGEVVLAEEDSRGGTPSRFWIRCLIHSLSPSQVTSPPEQAARARERLHARSSRRSNFTNGFSKNTT